MSKHDLRARPVFHHTRDTIEAHLTVVMASLAVARYLQDATGISIKRVIRPLKPLQEVTINLNNHHLTPPPCPLPCWWSRVVRGWASCCGHNVLPLAIDDP